MMVRRKLLTVATCGALALTSHAYTPAQASPTLLSPFVSSQLLLPHLSPTLLSTAVSPEQLLLTPPKLSVRRILPTRTAPSSPIRVTAAQKGIPQRVRVKGIPYLRFPYLPWRAEAVVNIALAKQGVPYVYGASPDQETLTSADCSSFLVFVFRQVGIYLPRVSWDQLNSGREVTREHVLPGDLIGFYGEGGAGGHIGLYIGNNRFIHAPQSGDVIRVSNLNNGPQVWKFVRVIPELG